MLTGLCIVLTFNGGCASSVVIGGLSGGVGALPADVSYVGRGKFESFQIARYGDIIEATLRAAEALSLDAKEEKIEDNRASYRYIDGKGKGIDILIEPRTDTITYIRINVGILGPQGMGRLVLEQIIDEVADAGDYLEDWTREIRRP